MIQLIANRPVPPSSLGRRLADPDLLRTIAERFERGDSGADSPVDDFSFVLGDLRMGGTWKRTSQRRLPQTEQMLCTYLTPISVHGAEVLDLGASEGLTTLELAAALRRNLGGTVRVTLADLNLWLFRYRKGPVCEYRAAKGEPIMVRIGRFGLRLARQRHDQPNNPDPVASFYLRREKFRQTMKLDAQISLIHPRVHSDPDVTVIELDCLDYDCSLKLKFGGVRASNILNAGYFTPLQINVALSNIHSYLVDGGCLVVSRNHNENAGETENGSIWRKDKFQFCHLADFGAGSEIRGVVDDWRLSRTQEAGNGL